jgi:hypothetical protein
LRGIIRRKEITGKIQAREKKKYEKAWDVNYFAQNTDKCRALTKCVMNFGIP